MAVLCVSVLLVCVCVCVCVGDAGRDGLRFSVEIGTSRCLFEELREGELVTGRFHSEREEKTQQRLSLKVFEPSNRRVFLKEDIAGEGEMVFSATDEGKYQFCFDNEHVGGVCVHVCTYICVCVWLCVRFFFALLCGDFCLHACPFSCSQNPCVWAEGMNA